MPISLLTRAAKGSALSHAEMDTNLNAIEPTVNTNEFNIAVNVNSVAAVTNSFNAHVGVGGNTHPNATTSVPGFMSAADKMALDNIPSPVGDMLKSDYATGSNEIVDKSIELALPVTNGLGFTANKGDLVVIDFNTLTITALARQDSKTWAVVMVKEDIINAQSGIVLTTGYLSGLNTSGFVLGDVLYLGATGGFTDTRTSPDYQVVGSVLSIDAVTGSLDFSPEQPDVIPSETAQANLVYNDPFSGVGVALTGNVWTEIVIPDGLLDINNVSSMRKNPGNAHRLQIDYSGSPAPTPLTVDGFASFSIGARIPSTSRTISFGVGVNGANPVNAIGSIGSGGNQTTANLYSTGASGNLVGLSDGDTISLFAMANSSFTLTIETFIISFVTAGSTQAPVGSLSISNITGLQSSLDDLVQNISILEAVSIVSAQDPVGTDNPMQVEFGVAQGSGIDPVQVDSLGTSTFNDDMVVHLSAKLQIGRSGAGGVSLVYGRALLNGVTIATSMVVLLDNSNIVFLMEFSEIVSVFTGDTLTFEIYRDSSGFNSGGLVLYDPTLAGWGNAPTASLKLTRLKSL